MTIDDEKFFAWLDGELDSAEAAEVEAEVAADPRLSKLAEQHRALGTRLKAAFDTVVEVPIPDELMAPAEHHAEVIDFDSARRARNARFWGRLPKSAALAATLALGIGLGTLIRPPSGNPVEVEDSGMYAAAGLSDALDNQLASAPAEGRLRVGLTFRDRAGAICRTFSGAQSSGLACRDGDRWGLRGLFSEPQGQNGEYRMAAGMDPNLAALVDSTMAGQPFDAVAEKAAKRRGWQ